MRVKESENLVGPWTMLLTALERREIQAVYVDESLAGKDVVRFFQEAAKFGKVRELKTGIGGFYEFRRLENGVHHKRT